MSNEINLSQLVINKMTPEQFEEAKAGGTISPTEMYFVDDAENGSAIELDTTLTQSGKAADAKAVGDALAALSGTNSELPFTENEISGVESGGGFGTKHTNFADGKTYFRYHAGSSYGFKWKNPNPQKGSLTITMRGYSQYSTTLSTKIVTVYTDGTDNSLLNTMYLKHGETVTYTTDPDKTVDYIRGNYDFENWVLLDMDVLSIVADYPVQTGTVKSVNGILPDENGNVEIEIPEGGGTDGDYIPVPPAASVGQTIKVSAVDENGKPTAWEATAPDGFELIKTLKFTEDTYSIDLIQTDDNGNPFELTAYQVISKNGNPSANQTFRINPFNGGGNVSSFNSFLEPTWVVGVPLFAEAKIDSSRALLYKMGNSATLNFRFAGIAYKNITQISWYNFGANYIKAGSVVEIWGIRV